MAKNVLMPQMGYDMDAGTLLRWLKQPGDTVERGEAIAEIETDKVNIEIEAFDSGILARTLITEGQTVPVGEVIAIIGEPGEEIAEAPAANGAAAATPAPAQAAVSAAGAAAAPPSVATVATIERPVAEPPAAAPEREPGERVRSSPLVRRLAAEHGIDLAQVNGSGPHGRIVKRDIEGMLTGAQPVPRAAEPAPTAASQPTMAPAAAPQPAREPVPSVVGGELQEFSRIRQTIGKRMQQSWNAAPHIFVSMSIDMGAAMTLREQVNTDLDEQSQLTVNDLVVKAVALALRKFPVLNSAYVDGKLELHERIDVGFAVAIEGGLISPFIPATDRASLGEIARKTKDLSRRAREGGLKPEEYAGGTFTTSNLGMFGVDDFTAIINPPQAAILAIGAAKMQPVWNAETEAFVPQLLMKVTISVDHRLSDGAEAAQYLRELKRLLEHPMLLLVG